MHQKRPNQGVQNIFQNSTDTTIYKSPYLDVTHQTTQY